MRHSAPVGLFAFLILVGGAGSSLAQAPQTNGHALMRSATGDSLGVLRLEQAPNGQTRLTGTLMGIPAGTHGIHVHTVGRCDAPTFESAGPHFNPANRKHGLENPQGPHGGDAPNIVADASNRATVDIPFAHLTMRVPSDSSVWDTDGSSIVVHAAADDQKTDPSGNSGARIACGLLTRDS